MLQTLEVTDKSNYRAAAAVLKKMRDAARAAGADAEAEFTASNVDEGEASCEEIFVDLNRPERLMYLHADAIPDHQPRQAVAVDQDDAGGHGIRIGTGTAHR
ncbi:hypothetical protein [Microbacterium suwonense]|uniref:hypothetical protein n=1 Tax=Microbacterium suwonense TaxID=683047 RepID=UPI0025738120|nr:hypothetical protein [Microbacterium suwonense]